MRSIIFGCVAFLCVCTPACWAHAPSDITARISVESQSMTVVVTHVVSDPTTHYVKRIVILVNGQQLAETEFQKQTDVTGQTAQIVIPAAIGPQDTVEIVAFCSRFGSLKKTVALK